MYPATMSPSAWRGFFIAHLYLSMGAVQAVMRLRETVERPGATLVKPSG